MDSTTIIVILTLIGVLLSVPGAILSAKLLMRRARPTSPPDEISLPAAGESSRRSPSDGGFRRPS